MLRAFLAAAVLCSFATAALGGPLPFNCDGALIMSFTEGMTPTTTHANLDFSSGSPVYSTIGTDTSDMNAEGYNTLDNFVYGVGTSNQLGRFGRDGNTVFLGTVSGLTVSGHVNTGDMRPGTNELWVASNGVGAMDVIDVTTGNVIASYTIAGSPGFADWAFTPDGNVIVAAGVSGSDAVLVGCEVDTDCSAGTCTFADLGGSSTIDLGSTGLGPFGGQFFDSLGRFYFFDNNQGTVRRATLNSNYEVVDSESLGGSIPSGRNDGAACSTGATATFEQDNNMQTIDLQGSGTMDLTYRYISSLPADSQTVTVTDTLPNGFEFTGTVTVTPMSVMAVDEIVGDSLTVELSIPPAAGTVEVVAEITATTATPGTYPNEALLTGLLEILEADGELEATANIIVEGGFELELTSPESLRSTDGGLFSLVREIVFIIDAQGSEIEVNRTDLDASNGTITGFRVLESGRRAVGSVFEVRVNAMCPGIVTLSVYDSLSLSVNYVGRPCLEQLAFGQDAC